MKVDLSVKKWSSELEVRSKYVICSAVCDKFLSHSQRVRGSPLVAYYPLTQGKKEKSGMAIWWSYQIYNFS